MTEIKTILEDRIEALVKERDIIALAVTDSDPIPNSISIIYSMATAKILELNYLLGIIEEQEKKRK